MPIPSSEAEKEQVLAKLGRHLSSVSTLEDAVEKFCKVEGSTLTVHRISTDPAFSDRERKVLKAVKRGSSYATKTSLLRHKLDPTKPGEQRRSRLLRAIILGKG